MHFVHYIPIITTLFSIFFLKKIFTHYLQKTKAIYLLWWSIGVLTYGLGTLSESINTIFGWSDINFRFWYIVGALLGGYPLAQGTIYLLLKKKTAHILTIILVLLISSAAICVLLSPVDATVITDGRLSGKALGWQWVRMFSPFINTYSFIFLFGGAIYSAFQYRKLTSSDKRFLGNIFIAIGSLLPGIGGTFTRFGYVEVLYVTELLGLVSIYYGYRISKQDPTVSVHITQSIAV
jgi:hypothetical protein